MKIIHVIPENTRGNNGIRRKSVELDVVFPIVEEVEVIDVGSVESSIVGKRYSRTSISTSNPALTGSGM